MTARTRSDSQLGFGPMELRDSEQPTSAFRKSEQPESECRESEQHAARILDEAFAVAGLDNKEIAHLCGVSQSLVEKWRSAEARGCPSLAQMLLLPPTFHIAMHRVMNRRFGFGRAALRRLLDDASDLALALEA